MASTSRRYCYGELLPCAVMVGVECLNVGCNILFKAASLKGLSLYVYNTYYFTISSIVLFPFIFIFPSAAVVPSSKFPLLSRICLLSFIGSLGQLLGYKGIEFSSPTLASAISNLTPGFTFILAIIFRMERVALRSTSTQAKLIGTIVSVSGAFVVVLYKGPTVFLSYDEPFLSSSISNWVIGGLLLVAQYLLYSIWYIVQTQVMKIYPAEFEVVFLYHFFAAIMFLPVSLIEEHNLSSWILKPSVSVVAVFYGGILGASVTLAHTWGVHLKGPVYIAIFRPLSIVIAAAMGAIFLGDSLYLGSVIGAVIISIGFYGVIWGKAKEEELVDDAVVKRLLATSTND